MSKQHPIIAVTGSSGAGTSTARDSFQHIFYREKINPIIIEGDSFHKYDRLEMREAIAHAAVKGENFSHFGPKANYLDKLQELFIEYGDSGTGQSRLYLHDEEEAVDYGQQSGTFTPWENIPEGTDVLFYEGLHGGIATSDANIAKYTDLLIGVVPIVNLEWIQKLRRDTTERGYNPHDVRDTILRRMYDYVHFIMPQFSRTDINFQRVPLVDTSNPFIARDVPSPDESMVIIRFRDPVKLGIDFPYLTSMLKDSFMSRKNTIVVPGGKMGLAMEIILTPIIKRINEERLMTLKSAKVKN